MTAVDDLSAWLTQIWDEGEARVREALGPDYAGERPKFYDVPGGHRDDWGLWTFHVDPAEVLARIAADRQILALHEGGVSYPEDCGICNEGMPCETVRFLAAPYADRLGYQESWRPVSPSQPESEPLP